MKKITVILLTFSLALSLCGCDNTTAPNDSENTLSSSQPVVSDGPNSLLGSTAPSGTGETRPSSSSGETSDIPEIPAQNDGELRLIYEGGLFRNGLITNNCTENGYYSAKFLCEDDRDVNYMNLTYVDFATHREIVLCSDSSCKHDNEKCASYLSGDEFFLPGVFVNGEYLYLLSSEYDQSGTTSAGSYTAPGYEPPPETRRAAIYRMNLDGTERQKIWEADNIGDVIEPQVYGDGESIWFAAKTPAIKIYENPDSEKNGAVFNYAKNRALMRYSPTENKIVERIPLDDYNNIALDIMGASDGKFILSGTAYPNGTSRFDNMEILAPSPNFGDNDAEGWEFRKKCEQVFFTLDPSTKEIKETFRTTYGKLYELENYMFDGSYMYCIREDYSVYSVDLFTGETREVNVPNGYRLDDFFMDKMCFTRVTEDWNDDNTYLTDLNGENMTASAFVNTSGFGSDYVILGRNGDKLIMIYETERIPSVNNPGAYNIGKRKAGLISIDDLINGRANFEPIDALLDSWE